MKIEMLSKYINLNKGELVDKDDFIAKKLIRLGFAKAVKELKDVETAETIVKETKEFKPKNKKTK